MARCLGTLWLGALVSLLCAPAFCQSDDLAVGKFLVASRDLSDPNFAQTVILLVRYGEDQGSVGLVINRRTDVPMSRVFEDLPEAKGRKDPVYVGGPVELNSVLALWKTSTKPDNATRLFRDVYLISSKSMLKAAIESGVDAEGFHIYVGYAGWGAGQLEHEVDLGAWHILPADAATVFTPDSDAVWERLIKRTETQVARRLIYTPPLR